MGFSIVFVVVTLAVMFVLTAPTHPIFDGVRPDLPRVNVSVPLRGAEREDVVHILVMRDGSVALESEHVIPDQMPAKIASLLKGGAERKAYLRVDREAPYAVVKEVLANVRAAGIEDVAFFTDEPRSEQ